MLSFLGPGRLTAPRNWRRRSWSVHAPQFVKLAVLSKYSPPGATRVETGSFKGESDCPINEEDAPVERARDHGRKWCIEQDVFFIWNWA